MTALSPENRATLERVLTPDEYHAVTQMGYLPATSTDKIEALLSAVRAEGKAVPDGYKLVPIGPTEVMLNAVGCELGEIHPGRIVRACRAMIAAAPSPPKQDETI